MHNKINLQLYANNKYILVQVDVVFLLNGGILRRFTNISKQFCYLKRISISLSKISKNIIIKQSRGNKQNYLAIILICLSFYFFIMILYLYKSMSCEKGHLLFAFLVNFNCLSNMVYLNGWMDSMVFDSFLTVHKNIILSDCKV